MVGQPKLRVPPNRRELATLASCRIRAQGCGELQHFMAKRKLVLTRNAFLLPSAFLRMHKASAWRRPYSLSWQGLAGTGTAPAKGDLESLASTTCQCHHKRFEGANCSQFGIESTRKMLWQRVHMHLSMESSPGVHLSRGRGGGRPVLRWRKAKRATSSLSGPQGRDHPNPHTSPDGPHRSRNPLAPVHPRQPLAPLTSTWTCTCTRSRSDTPSPACARPQTRLFLRTGSSYGGNEHAARAGAVDRA